MDNRIQLGPFELNERLAAGGMGEVWSGKHLEQNVPVAVKVLNLRLSDKPTYRTAFRREIEAVARLEHPNIVMVFDHGEVSLEAAQMSENRLIAGTPFLALEMVTGGSLSNRAGRMSWSEIRAVLLDLLSALAHAHARGVIHRDIKPGNVLIDKVAKLTDFGLAHAMHLAGGVNEATPGGTPSYMAPEQFRGSWRSYGPWTDLYALGCLGWALATGRAPFPGKVWSEVMESQLTQAPPPFLTHISVPLGFESWLRRLLRKDRRRRFQTAADAAHALDQLDDVVLEPAHPQALPPDVLEDKSTMLNECDDPSTTTLVATEIPGQISGIPVLPRYHEPIEEDEAPPLPPTWRQHSPARSIRLVGAGLGMYGLRPIPMVGRKKERDVLWHELRAVTEFGTPRLVALVGPVGCGKSRLAEWLCERASEVGAAQALSAIHTSIPGPTHGLARMMARHFRCVGLGGHPLVLYLATELANLGVSQAWEAEALANYIAPGEGRYYNSPQERCAALHRILVAMGRKRPVVVWADDVQWGSDFLRFASYLMHHRTPAPVLIVVTARDTGLAARPAERAQVANLVSHQNASQLDLSLLSPTESSALIRQLLFLEGELADRVQERVGGNPLFAVRLVGDWVQRGILEPAEGGFRLKPGVTVDLPDDLHEVWFAAVEGALRGSTAKARLTLELAAALGLEVDKREWREVCRQEELVRPDDIAPQLTTARLMRRVVGGWAMAHGMLRESLMRTAKEAGRWAHHNRSCAQMLRQRYKDSPAGLSGRLGQHALAAGDFAEAHLLLLTGAREAIVRSEFAEAIELLDTRIEALDELGLPEADHHRVEGWLVRAQVLGSQGRPLESDKWSKHAEEVVKTGVLPELHAPCFHHRAKACRQRGMLDDAEEYYVRAMTLYTKAGHQHGVADCLHGLGRTFEQRGRYDGAAEMLKKALTSYSEMGAELDRAHCLQALSLVSQRIGDLATAGVIEGEALMRFRELGSRSGEAASLRGLARIARLRRNFVESREYSEQALILFEQLGDPMGQQSCINGLAELARFEGKLEEAERGYRAALGIALSIGASESILPRINLALVVLKMGRYSEAWSMLSSVVDELEKKGVRQLLGGVHIGLMACAIGMGNAAAFKEHFHRGRMLLDQTQFADPDIAWPAETAAELAFAAAEPDWARACWELAMFQHKELGHREDVNRLKELLKIRFGKR
ncbi:MAG: tetratricopeptide repeat protein [Proteobacteria bacterium]|nr:tetratricopeptide repeat protein [Pseudomonadota bacterium]